MLQWLSRRRTQRRNAQMLYGAIVAQSRLPVFYAELRIPDTLEGRFEVLVLHMYLVLERLRAEGPDGEAIAQELVDSFVSDMDTTLREVGVGDLAVPKKMRRMSAAFYERLQAYREAFALSDPDAVAAVVGSYVYGGADAGEATLPRLVSYVRSAARTLRNRSLQNLFVGRLDLVAPEPEME